MAHISTRLSDHVELGATRREVDDLEVVRTDGGNEVRNSRWSQPLLEFEVSYPIAARDNSVLQEILKAYKATRGGLDSFDFQDWLDNAVTDQVTGTGDGSTTVFNLVKTYGFGSATFSRRIYRPVSPIVVKKDGVTLSSGYSVNYTTGVLTLTVAPTAGQVLTWTGTFNVPVRFDGPLESSPPATQLEKLGTISIVEVRL